MANYRQILVATDLLPECETVLERALMIARQNDAVVTLLHVVGPFGVSFVDETPLPNPQEIEEGLLENARQRLRQLTERHPGAALRSRLEPGSPKHEILRVAKEIEADLIVVGSHGVHWLELLIGSTATGVLSSTPCDLLAVRVA